MIVPNEQLKFLTIERRLPVNGKAYLLKGNDPEFSESDKLEIDK